MQGFGGGPKGRRRGLELGVSERRREGEEWEEKSGILYAAPQNPRKLLQRGDARWAVPKHGPTHSSAHHPTISVFFSEKVIFGSSTLGRIWFFFLQPLQTHKIVHMLLFLDSVLNF